MTKKGIKECGELHLKNRGEIDGLYKYIKKNNRKKKMKKEVFKYGK
jgi:hypothetical protein